MASVRGDLDHPPQVIENSRGIALLGVIFGLVMDAGCWWFARNPREPVALLLLVAVIVTLMAACSLVLLVRPKRLELSPSGLRMTGLPWIEFSAAWRSLGGFRIGTTGRTTRPVCHVAPDGGDYDAEHPSHMREIDLGGGWALSPDKIVRRLEDAKARWG